MKTYFGFAISPTMFPDHCEISKRVISADLARQEVEAQAEAGQLVSCCNGAHVATVAAMRERFGIDVPIHERAPSVTLERGDQIIVMGVTGLPRESREYTAAEINAAKFVFSIFDVH
ncbi:MAG: DUF1874 domain-containing protein [Desulfurellales bacterium]|nr:MAG: DUF1874 domain-containing protein [Desulfurellales bacterium]